MATDPGTRRQILEAAEHLIRCQGMHATTTRAIAQQAGCAEGTIYRHFSDKHRLLVELVDVRFPEVRDLIERVVERAGTATVAEHLQEVGEAAMAFFRIVLPVAVVPLSDHQLLQQQRCHFREADSGPLRIFAGVTAYLEREQELGRLSPDTSPRDVARLLLGGWFGQVFVEALVGEEARVGDDREFVAATVHAVLVGIEREKKSQKDVSRPARRAL